MLPNRSIALYICHIINRRYFMLTSKLYGNNRLIQKSITRVFPACFAATMTASISLMMDSLLAGYLIGSLSIAAVAIGNPSINILRSLVQTISCGSAVQLAVNIGRGDRTETNRTFSMGIFGSIVLGLIAVLVCILGAGSLVQLFGGTADVEAARQAELYIITCSFSILLSSINYYMGKVLSVYGCQHLVFFNAIISVLGNLIFSTLFVILLPEAYAIAGLGIGTSLATVACTCSNIIMVKIKKLPIRLSPKGLHLKDALLALKMGLPSSGNNLADGIVSGLVNNIILAGFGGDTMALSIYTVVKSVFSFGQATCMGTALSTAPLFGLLYGARDKNGLCRTVREGYKVGLFFTVVWCGILALLLPVLMRFYGMPGNTTLRNGALISLAFMPVLLALRIMTQLFESTGKVTMGILYSVIPDSVIYPLMLLVLMPRMGYLGVWLSLGANGILFLILMYLIRSLAQRNIKITKDRMLCLDESIRDNIPMMDISILSTTENITSFLDDVHDFLAQEKVGDRCAFITALCLEELSVDFVKHTQEQNSKEKEEIADIKLFSDENTLRLIIRNASKPYNPLDFDLKKEDPSKVGIKMAQKFAESIEYTYVYNLNIVTIDIAK